MRPVLKDILEDYEICVRKLCGRPGEYLKSYVVFAIRLQVMLNQRIDYVQSEVANAIPINQPRELPIAAPVVHDTPDVPVADKSFEESPVTLCVLGQRPFSRPTPPNI